ncbi:MAG: hypothetical protein GWO85_00330 [Simkaniaceae bacterium]|nr:hypothetical protein [Simkaniaceae bacterium]
MNSQIPQSYRKHIILWILILAGILIALKLGIDEKIVVFSTLVIGIFTQAFTGLAGIISLVPFVGPFIVKVFAIPIFWFLNATGYVISAVAIKKGYTKELAKSRVVTLALLIGIVLGYILGHLIPM